MICKRFGLKLTLISIMSLLGCSGTSGGEGALPAGPTYHGPTYHKDVAPILQTHCNGCHETGQIGPFALANYKNASSVAASIAETTAARTMPPWGAMVTDECQPRFGWKDNNQLTDEEIATLKAWSEAGAPEGDTKDATARAEPPQPSRLTDPDLVIEPQTPYLADGESDHFRCFVMDPKIAKESYINGIDVIPGTPEIVHHVIALFDPLEKTVPLAGPDGSFDCTDWMGFEGGSTLAFWAPGGAPHELPDNVGVKFPAGSKIVMQVHYHPAGKTTAPDVTKIALRFNKTVPAYRAAFLSFGNFPTQFPNGDGLQPGPNDRNGVEFFIPAGAKNHTETMRLALPAKYMDEPLDNGMRIYASMTHMHYVGYDMKISVERPSPANGEPAKECLIQTPKWNFHWQQVYNFDAPIEQLPVVKTGDILELRCSYNNTMNNVFLKNALLKEHHPGPMDTVLGESTLDEMCVGLFRVIVKN